MKAALILLFLLALTTTLSSLAFAAEQEQVVDTNGKPIVPGRSYYVLPSISSAEGGGGLRLGRTGNSQCPLTVLQDYSEVNKGIPVTFRIKEEESERIFTGTPLDVEFVHNPECVIGSPKWLYLVEDAFPHTYVVVGGAENHPEDKEIYEGTFRIQRYGRGYKLEFRPAILSDKPDAFFDVSRYDDEDGRRLTVTSIFFKDPYQVVFQDAAHDDAGRSVAA